MRNRFGWRPDALVVKLAEENTARGDHWRIEETWAPPWLLLPKPFFVSMALRSIALNGAQRNDSPSDPGNFQSNRGARAWRAGCKTLVKPTPHCATYSAGGDPLGRRPGTGICAERTHNVCWLRQGQQGPVPSLAAKTWSEKRSPGPVPHARPEQSSPTNGGVALRLDHPPLDTRQRSGLARWVRVV